MAFDAPNGTDSTKHQTDLDDRNNEIAGRDAGRMARFFNRIGGLESAEKRRRKADSTVEYLSELDRLLRDDPVYAALFGDFTTLLTKMEHATDTALEIAQCELAQILENAPTLNGKAVFRDENGQVWTEDGALLDPAIAANIQWPESAPSHQEYQRRKQGVEDLLIYQTDVLGRYRDRISDEDSPMTADEIELATQKVQQQAPAVLAAEVNLQTNGTRLAVGTPGGSEAKISIEKPEL